MANNIQIIGNILNTSTVNRYNSEDTQLLTSQELKEYFGETNDYIEYYIYDIAGNLLNINYEYKNFKLPKNSSLTPGSNPPSNNNNNIQTTDVGIVSNIQNQSQSLFPIIEIDPVQDLQNAGYTSGEFKVQYNFFKNKLSSPSAEFFIKEISSDRTELSIVSLILTNDEIENTFNSLVDEINNSSYFVDYLLNLGQNQQFLTVNIALNKLSTGYEILFKLYDPLPSTIQEKTSLWVVDEKVEPYIFDINLDTIILPVPSLKLRGPNFNIPLPDQGTISTSYQTYDSLISSIESTQKSSYNKISNLLSTQSIDINVDYTDFSNFVFFGSATKRLNNFYTKIQELENYNNVITTYSAISGSNPSVITEINKASLNINDIISKFDGFEYYMYFESSSYAWPKSTSTLPYVLSSSVSPTVTTWYNTYISSAETFDNNNVNNLETSIPVYILEDQNNAQYLLFLNMIGQYFDNIWIFLKSITDINDANNNLEQGVSKDLVYHVLKSYGVKLYNAQGGEDIEQFLIGNNSGSANFDNNFSPTGSYLNNIPRKDLLSEIYKRIYHNIPYLVKNKGTVAGIEALITTFGITGSILNVKEYGGSTKSELLKGYSTDKIRIVDNDTTGSVLSILTNVYQFPTSSNAIRDNDLHYVDVSFSPQNQIDTYLSSSISTSNPTFNLDDYIGDPRQLYSGSYEDLITQNKIYSAPFTSSYMDYNGFIRLIQFFDNSLFKMIEDFIPARASLSTGITINSTILERNKVSYAETTALNQEVLDAKYDAPTIKPEYGKLYDSLSGDKSDYFTGEFSGSEIDLYNKYFIPTNFNPYLQPTASFTPTDTNNFIHSDFNVLLNNVSSSVTSLTRKNLEYKFGTTGSLSNRIILGPSQLQDSYESLTSYVNSRHNGITLFSQKYNDYTDGDKSFGKTATIDSFSNRIGLFSEVTENIFLGKKSNIILKYLVDIDGGLTELNKYNKNWVSVQNIFKADKDLTISLFDNQRYSNQKFLDGVKPLYNSGYNYDALLYYSPNTETLNFYTPNYSDINYLEVAFFSNGKISGSSITYPINPSYYNIINNTLDNVIEDTNSAYITGSIGGTTLSSLSNYTILETSNYNIDLNLSFDFSASQASSSFYTPEGGYITYDMNMYLNPDEIDIASISSSTSIYNETKSYLSCEGKVYNPTYNYAVLDTNTNFTSYKISSSYAPSYNPTSATKTLTQMDVANTVGHVTFRFKVISNNLTAGETLEIYVNEDNSGVTLFITVDEEIGIISSNENRMAAFASKVITEINNTPEFKFYNIPTNYTLGNASIYSIAPNSFEISTQIHSGDNTTGQYSARMITLEKSSTLTPVITSDLSFLLPQDIYDREGNKILDKNTTIYRYNNLNDINLSTEVSSSITTFWNKNPTITLSNKANSGSLDTRYSATLFAMGVNPFMWNKMKFKYFYALPSDIGDSYLLPSNVTDFINLPSNINQINPQVEQKLNFINADNLYLQQSDTLYFALRETDVFPSTFNYGLIPLSSNISLTKITSNPNVVSIPYDGTGFFTSGSTISQLIFSSRLSNVLIKDNIFYDPNRDTYVSDLYNTYGDINVLFSLQENDVLVIKDRNDTVNEYTINNTYYDGINIYVNLKNPIPQQVLDNILGRKTEILYYEIIFLNKLV